MPGPAATPPAAAADAAKESGVGEGCGRWRRASLSFQITSPTQWHESSSTSNQWHTGPGQSLPGTPGSSAASLVLADSSSSLRRIMTRIIMIMIAGVMIIRVPAAAAEPGPAAQYESSSSESPSLMPVTVP